MYNFTESGDSDIDLSGTSETQNSKANGEREWTRMSDQFSNAGYREGITAGKDSALQVGFDAGFANTGAPIGRELGNLRGLAAGVLALLESNRPFTHEWTDKDELLAEVRDISRGLLRLKFVDLAPPDEEALAHEREHTELNDGGVQLPTNTPIAAADGPAELSTLRQRLRKVLETLKLDTLPQTSESVI